MYNALTAFVVARCRRSLCSKARAVSSSTRGGPPIHKLLVANRGEIACRVIATAKRLGIPTVAVFSEADRNALHVELADQAVCIGPAAARESYLRGDRILEVARSTSANAIHPGYGFLSENADFARACASAGVSFVGPPAESILAMGDKSRAKATMIAANVPVVPGYHGADQDESLLVSEAEKIGYPILVKAVSGGGGKGMKLATSEDEFLEALRSARREAISSFGDDRVLLEKYITRPRHIEVQIFSDVHGNAVYLAERDCSVQRRHQKIIEEAPAPGVTPDFRRAIGSAAVAAAQAVGYVNAGTVEFIVDAGQPAHCSSASHLPFYFMEMNTRLQVEHPVTEAVMGVDLVEWQLRIASGEPLPLSQEALAPRGHALEARLYAEDPTRGFLPGGGTLMRWRPPRNASSFDPLTLFDRSSNEEAKASIRVDSGVRAGDKVGVDYDPMIAKVIARSDDRERAIQLLDGALGELQVSGFPTNAAFMQRVLNDDLFIAGGVDTSFIAEREERLLSPEPVPSLSDVAVGALLFYFQSISFARSPAGYNFRLNYDAELSLTFTIPTSGQDAHHTLNVKMEGKHGAVLVTDKTGNACTITSIGIDGDTVSAEVENSRIQGTWSMYKHAEEHILDVWLKNSKGHFQLRRSLAWRWGDAGSSSSVVGSVITPMPGKVVKVFVTVGDKVKKGDALLVVEAMKMEHTVKAPCSGELTELHAHQNTQVADGAVLAVVQMEEAMTG